MNSFNNKTEYEYPTLKRIREEERAKMTKKDFLEETVEKLEKKIEGIMSLLNAHYESIGFLNDRIERLENWREHGQTKTED